MNQIVSNTYKLSNKNNNKKHLLVNFSLHSEFKALAHL